MRPPIMISIPILFNSLAVAYTLDCSHIRVDTKKFDLSKLGGPHSVTTSDKDHPPSIRNTTWTVDICAPLKKQKGVDDHDQCSAGTNVCGITNAWNPVDDPDQKNVIIESVISVAGSITETGSALDPKYTRLKASDSTADGLQMELHGGKFGVTKQTAVLVFVCDRDRTGNEGNEAAGDRVTKRHRRDDKEDDDESTNSLSFVGYGHVEGKADVDILRLNWRTKYACEDFEDDDDDDGAVKKSSWGFFTWFIVITFLGVAAYLIFGSWLNYNRYGARGWDLLPHGDTIRDVPYLVKDWSRKVVDTVSGGGSRGGYSAV